MSLCEFAESIQVIHMKCGQKGRLPAESEQPQVQLWHHLQSSLDYSSIRRQPIEASEEVVRLAEHLTRHAHSMKQPFKMESCETTDREKRQGGTRTELTGVLLFRCNAGTAVLSKQ